MKIPNIFKVNASAVKLLQQLLFKVKDGIERKKKEKNIQKLFVKALSKIITQEA